MSRTNCANVRSARCASATVASKVSSRSLGSPKMNEPSTWTPCRRNALQPRDQLVAREVEALVDVLQPGAVTASTPTSAPRMCARLIASRNSGSSAASIVICV